MPNRIKNARFHSRSQSLSVANEPMKSNHKLVLALAALAGVSIGGAGAMAFHIAQEVKTPSAHWIAEVEVTDPVTMQKCGEKVRETLAPFNGHYHYLVEGGKEQTLEGEAPRGIVVIAFDSMEQARAWYDSPAYEAIKPVRQSAAKTRIFIAEGFAPQ
jgi:uncharacterized protein (DUF1330 family)